MARAYLGLGSNVGDSRAHILAAIEKIKDLGTVLKISSFYKTEPVGFKEQAWFLNCALALETKLSPEELLRAVKKIERDLGRTPSVRNGPRIIDIDILLYDDIVLKTEALTIPHPRMHERAFALAPLAEIAPGTHHPVLKKTLQELLLGLADTHTYEKIPTNP